MRSTLHKRPYWHLQLSWWSSLLDRQHMVGHRDTKTCRIQPLPQEVYIIILNGEKAGILHLRSAFKFTKYTAI